MKEVDLRSHFEDAHSLPRATTLLKESGLRTVLFHVKEGEKLPEHNVAGAITVLCLTGQCTLLAGPERLEMWPNILASLGPGVPHSVVAQEDTLLLVVIADSIPAQPSTPPRTVTS
jgi:quercetin dioxygenase-like cupin family protein